MSRTTESLPLPSGSRLEVRLGRVEATLTAWDREEVAVDSTAPVELSEGPEGACLVLRSAPRGDRVEISAPRRLRLVVSDEASHVTLHGFEGRIELATRDGRVEGSELRGELDLRVERGEVRLRELFASFAVSCGRGTVSLGLLGIPGESRVRVDGGRVDLDVPEGLDASFGTRTRSFWSTLTVRAEFGQGGAPVELDVRRGEVRLFKAGEWKGTLRPRGEVRLKGWDDRRRRQLRELVARLHTLRNHARRPPS